MSETKQQEATTDVMSETGALIVATPTDAPAVPETENKSGVASTEAAKGYVRRGPGAGANDKRNQRRPRRGGRPERVRPEFEQKIISIRRVTRVMAGGRRFSFSVAMVIGDKRGKVGVAHDYSFNEQGRTSSS
jgi:Ribosomal protein S5, N-terminal domain